MGTRERKTVLLVDLRKQIIRRVWSGKIGRRGGPMEDGQYRPVQLRHGLQCRADLPAASNTSQMGIAVGCTEVHSPMCSNVLQVRLDLRDCSAIKALAGVGGLGDTEDRRKGAGEGAGEGDEKSKDGGERHVSLQRNADLIDEERI